MSTSSNDPLALARLRDSVARIDARTARGERQRKWFWIVQAAFLAALVVLLFLYIEVVRQRADSRRYYNEQLHRLACTAIEYTPDSAGQNIHDLRAQYTCPRASKPPKPHARTNSDRTGSTHSGTTPQAGGQRVTPTAIRTRHVAATQAPKHPAATKTRSHPSAHPTRTSTTPRTSPRPSPSSSGLIGGVVCRLVHCPVLP